MFRAHVRLKVYLNKKYQDFHNSFQNYFVLDSAPTFLLLIDSQRLWSTTFSLPTSWI